MTSSDNPKLEQMVQDITTKVVEGLDSILLETVQAEISSALSKSLSNALKDGEFFRKVNDDMREGLEQIYGEIKKAKKDAAKGLTPEDTNELINQASDELDAILESTESATVKIMDIVEDHQERVINAGTLLQTFRTGGASKDNVNELIELNQKNQQDLMEIITALSFQDLTGQRIKKIITALKKIEEIVFNVYMSTGLKVRARDQEPGRDEKEIEKLATKTVKKLSKDKIKGSKLKGPQKGTSQDDVDDLLAQLGL
ncbi:protein phosphatase CheZ [Desulfovibrio ferrophilus]|uniref:Putative chemotaxis phosphatase, CheZ n=1 Tax=Desulfovibrio ferrophilus TaxID=241368 RepID=A0A2Z6AX20_9BACT|nr:protein phosphatase CheZ [Desulfovibrio ferrophilus]BBD07755.1 putative chemotaxis phosphatase, CheZ [Desulfovibrio ferrophilus]